jgi:predicted RNA-binding Zn-ribbon protein involved in translation (DUF1610 family)
VIEDFLPPAADDNLPWRVVVGFGVVVVGMVLVGPVPPLGALVLLVGVVWLARELYIAVFRRRTRWSTCAHCGQSLRELGPTGVCPGCGEAYRKHDHAYHRRRGLLGRLPRD